MTHLTESQFVDALEGRIDPTGRLGQHLALCETCQADLAGLAETWGLARAVDVPEPSPLFWDHLSRRISAATSTEVGGGSPAWVDGWSLVWRPITAVLVAMGAVALVLVLRSTYWSAPAAIEPAEVATVAYVTPTELANDDALNMLAVLAQDLRTDELQQVAHPSADATGAAIEQLTPAQRVELVRLIKSQTGGAE